MYLEEIVLDGFKSYANRTVISGFNSKFNAITGLNGSGKSNVLDAICFVLGITNLNQVRVKNLQELVYKQGQAGITKATVTLIFNNEQGDQSPIGYEQYDRITITRQVVIGGRNKYLIQGHTAQVNQVQNLFHSVQLNVNNPHFLIMQGHITKVLNMKPCEILGMVEEACGTRLYEMKKVQAQKTMEKKDSKVGEITKILMEDITPTLEKLRSQRSAYLQWASNSTEIERLHRQKTAYAYYEARETLRGGDVENRLIAEELNLTDMCRRLSMQSDEMGESVKRLQEEKMGTNGCDLEEVHKREVGTSKELVRENSNYVNEIQALDREKQEVRRTEERVRGNECAMEELTSRLRRKRVEAENLEKDAAEEKVRVEEMEKRVERVERGEEGEGGASFSELVSVRREQVERSSQVKQLRQRWSAVQMECVRAEEAVARRANEAERGEVEVRSCEGRIQTARSEVSECGFDNAEFDRVQNQLRSAESREGEVHRKLEEAESQLGANLQFSYSDPESNFDRSRVKGLVAELIEVRDERYAQAVEVAAGGKLYQVVVDTEKTGQALLKNGHLQRRVTIIPLNRIKHRTLPPQKVLQAQRLAPSGYVCLALTLVGYEESVQEAVEYVFGSTLVCESLDIARKVAFNPGVRARTVTMDGDVFEPSGVLEGGSRRRSAPVLSLLGSANRLREERESVREEVCRLRAQLTQLSERRVVFSAAQSRLELELHNLEVLDKSGSKMESVRMSEEARAKRKEVNEFERQVCEAMEGEKRGAARLVELEEKEKAMRSATMGSSVGLHDELEASRLAAKNKAKVAEQGYGEVEELSLELDELRREADELRASVSVQQETVSRHGVMVDKLEMRVRELKEEYEGVKREAGERREDARRQSEEIRTLEKQFDTMKHELESTETKLKQVCVKKMKLQKARCEAENRVESMVKQYGWLGEEEGTLGKAGTDYDFASMNMEEVSRRVEVLEEEQEQLGRRLNKKVLGMMEKAEGEYQELLKKRRIIENDRSQIEKVIEELDVKKKETLASTYTKVNSDFGSIFSTLLPGASVRLEPPVGGTVLDGLEVRVAFGGKEKESLSELSGGQRSLLALSLVLSLLLFKPAPMYILDEVDAALDLSHTQNIGHMLRKHFGQSQFIVVSLKEGMFNNANVIFRTKFIDGVSTITRTLGQLQNDEEKDNEQERGKRMKKV